MLHNKLPAASTLNYGHVSSCCPSTIPAWLKESLNQCMMHEPGSAQVSHKDCSEASPLTFAWVGLPWALKKKMHLQLFPFTASSLPQRPCSRSSSRSSSPFFIWSCWSAAPLWYSCCCSDCDAEGCAANSEVIFAFSSWTFSSPSPFRLSLFSFCCTHVTFSKVFHILNVALKHRTTLHPAGSTLEINMTDNNIMTCVGSCFWTILLSGTHTNGIISQTHMHSHQ